MTPTRDVAEPPPGQTGPSVDDDEPLDDAFELALALEEEGNLDDSVASDLDHGIDVAGEDPSAGDGDEPSLDVGLAGFQPDLDETEGEGEGDEAGPVGESAASDVGQEEEFDGDETEGGSDRLDEFVPSELPSLDTEAGETDAGPADEPIELAIGEEDEDAPRPAELAWAEVALPVAIPPCSAVVVNRSALDILAGGTEVFTVDDAGARRTLAANLGDSVTSLVPGVEPGTVLFTTRSGELWRCAPGKSMPEQVVAFREESQVDSLRAPEIVLGGPTPSQRPAILLHVKDSGGTLLESTDYGTTWRRVELGGMVMSLSIGSPPLCLVDTGRALRFFLSEPSGGFSPVGTPYSGETDALVMASQEDASVLLSPGHGVSVSASRGAAFKTVLGCSHATAVTAGRLGTRLSAFAALFDAASGRATLVWIDAVSAEAFAVATVEPSDDDDDDFCRVESLAWDPHTETLWAGGLFGMRRFRRPPSA